MLVSPRVDLVLLWVLRLGIWFFAFGLAAAFTIITFQRRDEIVSYSAPKPETIETPLKKPAPAPGEVELKFEEPEGWTETAGTQFSRKAFEVVDGDQRIDITVSQTGGDLLQNMNRWRQQVGLPDLTVAELSAAFKPREVNGRPAKCIEMHSPENAPEKQSILGVVVEDADGTWFIKLRGATALAERERERFEAFAKSLSW